MPELPEVRTVAKTMKNKLLNKKITKIKVIYPNIIEKDSLNINLLLNQKLEDIETYGKYLIFKFTDYDLISHLRMEGKFNVKKINDPIVKHEHVIFEFDDLSVRYADTRKFGKMILVKKNTSHDYAGLKKLGPEPFKAKAEELKAKYNSHSLPMKSLLLDQTIMSGLGNIYADEVLFASKIDPLRKGKDINLKECEEIINSAKNIFDRAILNGGTTIRSYTSGLGVIGHYQQYLMVHKREGELCETCQTKIKKIKVGGRSTYFCPKCQK